MFSRKFFFFKFSHILYFKILRVFCFVLFNRFDHLLKIYKNSLDNIMICLVYWPIFCSSISSHFQTGKGFWQHFCNYPWCLFLQYSPLRTYCISVSQGRLDLFYKVFFLLKLPFISNSPLSLLFFIFYETLFFSFNLKMKEK